MSAIHKGIYRVYSIFRAKIRVKIENDVVFDLHRQSRQSWQLLVQIFREKHTNLARALFVFFLQRRAFRNITKSMIRNQ